MDTGRAGPRIAVFGELDALIIPAHPECDPKTGAVHACGHHCQSAALLGVAALQAPGVLDGLSGSIRRIAVPAKESEELDFRKQLKQQGVTHHLTGKPEFMTRGALDGVDIAMGAQVILEDQHGYAPLTMDPMPKELLYQIGTEILGEDNLHFNNF